jgi:hypothetical protein
MFYHDFRVTLAEFNYGEPVFLITKRHDPTVFGKTASVSSAIDLIQLIEKQLPLFGMEEAAIDARVAR